MTPQEPRAVDEDVPDTMQLLRELLEVRRRMSIRAQPSKPPPRPNTVPPPGT